MRANFDLNYRFLVQNTMCALLHPVRPFITLVIVELELSKQNLLAGNSWMAPWWLCLR